MCCQYLSSSSGTSPSSAFQSTPRVTMSSISRARSPASASVEAGPPTTSGAAASAGFCRPGGDKLRQRQPALSSPSFGGMSSGAMPPAFGVFREGEFVLVDVAERDDARQHRRVGLQHIEKDFARHAGRRAGSADRASPAPAVPDCVRASKPSTSRPSTSAAMTVRRNGADTGTLKTRMGCLIRGSGRIMAWAIGAN